MEEYFGHLLVRAIDYVCRFQHTGMVHFVKLLCIEANPCCHVDRGSGITSNPTEWDRV